VIDMKRRAFLRASAAGTALAVVAGAGLLQPTRVWAEAWPAAPFKAKKRDAALKALFGTSSTSSSDAIQITANLQAEDGSSVPVAVSTSLKNVDTFAILVHENTHPLITDCRVGVSGAPYYRANIKMAKTSVVEFVVKAGGKLYTASQKIKVTAGGCGG
jgi:sulfur-oxidizing protein SoxY